VLDLFARYPGDDFEVKSSGVLSLAVDVELLAYDAPFARTGFKLDMRRTVSYIGRGIFNSCQADVKKAFDVYCNAFPRMLNVKQGPEQEGPALGKEQTRACLGC